MNAKFEKWFASKFPGEYTDAMDGYLGGKRCMEYANSGYQYAIQSLEVTPELEDVAMNSLPQSVVEEFGYDYLEDHISNALEAVLSALKEQAK